MPKVGESVNRDGSVGRRWGNEVQLLRWVALRADGGFLDMSVAGEKLAASENRSKLGSGSDVVRCLGVWVYVNISWVVLRGTLGVGER
jgi:hypothetical protein